MPKGFVLKKIILASASPRRKEILKEMGLDFEIVPSDYDEKLENDIFSVEKIEMLALNKAKDVFIKFEKSQSALVLSADTVVVLQNKILGKPKDEKEAFLMLKNLSDKKHSVVTSVCGICVESEKTKIVSTVSYVVFKELSDKLIKDYIEKYMPLDKAGSYGIQELPDGFVSSVEGSFKNIMGLCPKAVEEVIYSFKK